MRGFLGELIGTFVLVFIGCGSVGWAIFIDPLDLWQISIIWGVGVALAIYSSMAFSHAHLNPAVSLGFLLRRELKLKELLPYLSGQFTGAFLAAIFLYFSFESYIVTKDIQSAMMFGEYFPNPGNHNLKNLSMSEAFAFEALGTFLLMFGILIIVGLKLKNRKFINPLLIGVLLAVLIYFIAPYTQAGFNPARDFSPRLLSTFFGWDVEITFSGFGWFVVYILAPFTGSLLAVVLNSLIKKKGHPVE